MMGPCGGCFEKMIYTTPHLHARVGKTWGYVGKVVSLCGDCLGRVTVPVKIEKFSHRSPENCYFTADLEEARLSQLRK